MKKLLMTTAAMMLLGTTAAQADSMAYGTHETFAPNEFTVTGDGNGYKTVTGHDKITFDAYLSYDTGTAGRVKSWRLEPRLTIGNDDIDPFWLESYSKGTSYPALNRPKKIDIQTTMFVGMSTLKGFILHACNSRLQARLNNGLSPVQAYGTEATVATRYDVSAKVDANGAGSGNPVFESGGLPKLGTMIRCKPIAITPNTPGLVKAPKPSKPGYSPDAGRAPTPEINRPDQRPAKKANLVPLRPASTRSQTAGRP